MKKAICILCSQPGTLSFKFPKKAEIRQKWLNFCLGCMPDDAGISDNEFKKFLTSRSASLCINHFHYDLMNAAAGKPNSRNKLKKTAVPTIPPDQENLRNIWKGVTVTKKKNKVCFKCGTTDDNLRYFCFREEWKSMFKKTGLNKNMRFCEKHFSPRDIEVRGFKSFLAKGAFPIFKGSSVCTSSDNGNDDYIIIENPSVHVIAQIEEPSSSIASTENRNVNESQYQNVELNDEDTSQCSGSKNTTNGQSESTVDILASKHCQSCTCSDVSYVTKSSQIEGDLILAQSASKCVDFPIIKAIKQVPGNASGVSVHQFDVAVNEMIVEKVNVFDGLPNGNDISNVIITSEKSDEATPARFKMPRYVGDIQTSHLNTPQSARYCVRLCQKTLLKKETKIKNSLARENRLKKRIAALEKMVADLTAEKNTFSD